MDDEYNINEIVAEVQKEPLVDLIALAVGWTVALRRVHKESPAAEDVPPRLMEFLQDVEHYAGAYVYR